MTIRHKMIAGMTAAMILAAAAGSVFAQETTAPDTTQPAEELNMYTGNAEDIMELGNTGYSMEIPEFIRKNATIQTEGLDKNTIVKVSETASLEANEKQNLGYDTAGWIFSISKAAEDEVKQLRCGDMSGCEVFAQDGNGTFYLFEHPTDVTLVRESYDNIDKDLNGWSEINTWASECAETAFIGPNKGLVYVTCSNSNLDIHFARIAFRGETSYTISTTQFGPLNTSAEDGSEALDAFLNHAHIVYSDSAEAPDGEYVVLTFPEENVRYDFFTADKNLVREVITLEDGEEYESFYTVYFDVDGLTATDVMQAWYDKTAAEQGRK